MPFGTQLDVYKEGYEWINHSIRAISFSKVDENPKVKIGSSQCEKPYNASLFNISAMSYGSLSKNAILALMALKKVVFIIIQVKADFRHITCKAVMSFGILEQDILVVAMQMALSVMTNMPKEPISIM